jgi:hypothetical protein
VDLLEYLWTSVLVGGGSTLKAAISLTRKAKLTLLWIQIDWLRTGYKLTNSSWLRIIGLGSYQVLRYYISKTVQVWMFSEQYVFCRIIFPFLARWQQNLIGVIMLDIEYQSEDEMEPQVFFKFYILIDNFKKCYILKSVHFSRQLLVSFVLRWQILPTVQ